MSYNIMTYEELMTKSISDPDIFQKIPIKHLRKIITEHEIEESLKHGNNDSGIMFEKKYLYEDIPEKTLFDIFPFKEGKKIILYLIKDGTIYKNKAKAFATHVLEQVFDDQGNVVSEEIKPFTYNGD